MTSPPPRDRAPRAWKVYDYVSSELAAGRRFPSEEAIRWNTGVPPGCQVADILLRICDWGLLVRTPRQEWGRRNGSRRYDYALAPVPGNAESSLARISEGR